MSTLQSITRGKAQKPPRILIHGGEGIGKSTFGASAPEPVFIQLEDGLDEIDVAKFPRASSYDEVKDQLGSLRREQHEFRTLVIDSADWLERIIHDEICQREGKESIVHCAGGYGRGYEVALAYWREMLAELDALRERGMIVIFTAHSKVEKFEDPEAPTYDRYSPRLHKSSAALLCEWCDAVLFATRRFRTQTVTNNGRSRTTAVAIGSDGGERIIRPYGSPSAVAKNRYGLTSEIPLSWNGFVEAIAAAAGTGSPSAA